MHRSLERVTLPFLNSLTVLKFTENSCGTRDKAVLSRVRLRSFAMDLETCKIKQTQATAWGNGAELYAANLHEGSGIMMPLIAAYAETAREEVKGNPLILDIASGTGEPGISLARQFPNGSVIMTDLADGMIEGAKGRAERLSIKNAR